jgi:hypothetical protein
MGTRRFFAAFLAVFILFVIMGSVQSCGNRDAVPRVDFTIDLTQPQYNSLNNIGGSVLINNVIVCYGPNGYFAVSGYCTYDDVPLTFPPPYSNLYCPGCQSTFYTNGAVEFGLAKVPLIQYATQLNGTQLQVYTP